MISRLVLDAATATPAARRLFLAAADEAQALRHTFIGCEHLAIAASAEGVESLRVSADSMRRALLAFYGTRTPTAPPGWGGRDLADRGDEEMARRVAEAFGPEIAAGEVLRHPVTPRLERVIRAACSHATRDGVAVDAVHVVLALARERSGVHIGVWSDVGLDAGLIEATLTFRAGWRPLTLLVEEAGRPEEGEAGGR